MSTYGPINGIWTAGSYDLLTTILRKDWGYQGVVMTDWWAKMNEEGEEGSQSNTIPMVRAQNDVTWLFRILLRTLQMTTRWRAWQMDGSQGDSWSEMQRISVIF